MADEPSIPGRVIGLGGSYCNFGHLLRHGDARAAQALYDRAVTTLEPVYRRDPRQITAREFLRNSHSGRADNHVTLGDYKAAAVDYGRAADLSDEVGQAAYRLKRAYALARSGDHTAAAAAEPLLAELKDSDLYDAACVFCLCVTAAGSDALADRYAARAVALLRQAVATGYRNFPHLLTDPDPDLAPLRGRADFIDFLWDCADSP